jgi:two-component system chemotaxis response regulator CheY
MSQNSDTLYELSSAGRRENVFGRSALVVEDDPRLQRLMSAQLRSMGLRVLSASNYQAAVIHLMAEAFAIACIDVGLPNKSGYDLCEHVRSSLGLVKMPIVVTSDHGSPTDMAYAEDAGGNAFLRKPFSMQQLARCIESMLDANRRSGPLEHELQLLGTQSASPQIQRIQTDRKRMGVSVVAAM